jgi:hypothetical protein
MPLRRIARPLTKAKERGVKSFKDAAKRSATLQKRAAKHGAAGGDLTR